MDVRQLFGLRYDDVHVGLVDGLFADLTDAQARARPHGVNSVAWLVWHMTRVEDAVMSRFLADRPQVLDEGAWNARMALTRRDVGAGMTSEEVDALSGAVDLGALRSYQRAVAERTRALVSELPVTAWDAIVAPADVRRHAAADAMLVDAGRWVEEFWAKGHSRGWYFLQVGLLHPYGHCFEGLVTRGMLGL
ncbi:MAG TPA: DinB family protein [Terriglobales bacterium]|nr:DinB family protein [Terriglobales bacterium]